VGKWRQYIGVDIWKEEFKGRKGFGVKTPLRTRQSTVMWSRIQSDHRGLDPRRSCRSCTETVTTATWTTTTKKIEAAGISCRRIFPGHFPPSTTSSTAIFRQIRGSPDGFDEAAGGSASVAVASSEESCVVSLRRRRTVRIRFRFRSPRDRTRTELAVFSAERVPTRVLPNRQVETPSFSDNVESF